MPKAVVSMKTYRFDQMAKQINDRVDNPSKSGVERYVGLEHLDPDSIRIRRWGDITDVESTKLRFKPGDIIFGKRRVYQRKLAVADFEGICSAHAMVLRAISDVVSPDFLPFFMQSDYFMERALGISVGSLSPTINWTDLAEQEFALPPIQEQRRLKHALAAASDVVDSYRILEESHKVLMLAQFSRILRGEASALPSSLSEAIDVTSWNASKLGDLCILGSGHGFKPTDWSDSGMPIIRIQNVRGSTEFNYFNGEPDPSWVVEPGELLFAWAGVPGVSFGPGIWSGPRAVLNQHIYRVTPRNNIERDWLFEVLLYLTPMIERRAHGFKTSLLHIRKVEFTSQKVLLPPSVQQGLLAKWMRDTRDLHHGIKSRSSLARSTYAHLLSNIGHKR